MNLGIKGKKSEGELLTTNPKFLNVSRYYKDMPFDLKAGQGIVFFMQTTAFTPLVVLIGKDGKTFGTQRELKTEKDKKEKEARVAFIAHNRYDFDSLSFYAADSSFRVFFTSVEENATGKFTYGYKLIDAAQMTYDSDSAFFCQRLSFLINHWQADWDIIPESTWSSYTPNTSSVTDLCLLPAMSFKTFNRSGNRWGDLSRYSDDGKGTYSETLYSSPDANDRLKFFTKIVGDIKQCLDEKSWVFEEGTQHQYGDVWENFKYVTKMIVKDAWLVSYFYRRGAIKDQKLASFKIMIGLEKKDAKDVVLIFN